MKNKKQFKPQVTLLSYEFNLKTIELKLKDLGLTNEQIIAPVNFPDFSKKIGKEELLNYLEKIYINHSLKLIDQHKKPADQNQKENNLKQRCKSFFFCFQKNNKIEITEENVYLISFNKLTDR